MRARAAGSFFYLYYEIEEVCHIFQRGNTSSRYIEARENKYKSIYFVNMCLQKTDDRFRILIPYSTLQRSMTWVDR